ncbi:MAG: GTP 3',8-cyclase MoaA [Lachnospiraceae bacterium]|nr:GTP 3',8-cyclase MoaA [Lachnospiraceae bacterium]
MKDSFGREITYLRLSVTDLCNLRCRYCMPKEGVCLRRHEEMLTEEEMTDAVTVAAELGIRKVRITGGEPLVKKNILSICKNISHVPGIEEVCLTTNGTLLSNMAADLKAAGIQRINISIDTLNEEKYSEITRGGRLKDALCGIEAALNAGFEKVKLNTVLIGGFNDDEIKALAELTREKDLDVRFIELMPMLSDSGFGEDAFIPVGTVKEKLPEVIFLGRDGVAELMKLPGAKGNIGLISPISCRFCASCNRLRLTADGKIKPCLHSPLEYDIKGLKREQMKDKMKQAILAKPESYGKLSYADRSCAGRTMDRIGG